MIRNRKERCGMLDSILICQTKSMIEEFLKEQYFGVNFIFD